MEAPSTDKRRYYSKFRVQVEEDEVICRFGREYFRGARLGSFVGGVSAGFCSWLVYRRLRIDQSVADREMGFTVGVRNPDFPRSVICRGLRSQPLLAASCLCLQLTCAFKAVKTVLAHRRCREFYIDDIGYELLLDMAKESDDGFRILQQLREEVMKESLKRGSECISSNQVGLYPKEVPLGSVERMPVSPSTSNRQWTVNQLIQKHNFCDSNGRDFTTGERAPKFRDGVAVGLLGSIFDCYLPQHQPSAYLNMRFGYGL